MGKKDLFVIGTCEVNGMVETAPIDLTQTAYALSIGEIAVGESDNAIFCESAVDDPEIPVSVAGIYHTDTGKINLSALNSTLRREVDVKILTTLKSEQERISGIINQEKNKVLLAMMIYAVINNEKSPAAADCSAHLAELQQKIRDCDTDFRYAAKNLMDTLITATTVKKEIKFPISEVYPSVPMTVIDTGEIGPSKVIIGEFEIFRAVKPAKIKVKFEDIKTKFFLNPGRIFTDEEKAHMLQIPEYIELSERVLRVAEMIKASWSRPVHLRKLNILFEGPNGTGKTIDARMLSVLLGIPYTKVTCFADMQMMDVLGGFLPKVDDDTPSLDISDDDIMYDPIGSYERITGIKKPDATAEDVKAALVDFYKSDEGKNTAEYIFYLSEIVKAFVNGWLCEIQEPTCVRDAAVLMALNGALEPDGMINLPHKTVKRHPECIFVMTTNRSYEGCRPLNQSFRDRFSITERCELPEEAEVVSRLKKATGCKDTKFLKVLVQSMLALNKEMEDRGIIANVSLRGMGDLVADVMDGFDYRSCLNTDIIYRITTDPDDLTTIYQFLENCTPLYSNKYTGASK